MCPSVLLDELAEAYSTPVSSLSVFTALYFWAYAVMQPVGGTLADVVEPAWLLFAASAILFFASLLMGTTSSFSIASLGRVLHGVGSAPIYIPAARVLVSWYSAEAFPLMGALLLLAGGFGSVLAASPIKALAAVLGVRGSMLLIGALALLAGSAALVTVRSTPVPPSPAQARAFFPPLLRPGSSTFKEAFGQILVNARLILSAPRFFAIGLWGFCSCAAYFAVAAMWGTKFALAADSSLTATSAASVTIAFGLTFALGQPVFIRITDACHSRKWPLVASSALTALVAAGFIAFPDLWSTPPLVVAFALFAFCAQCSVSAGYTTLKEAVPPAMSGAIMSLANLLFFCGPGTIMVLTRFTVTPCDDDTYCAAAFQTGLWPVVLAASIVGALLLLLWPETHRRPPFIGASEATDAEMAALPTLENLEEGLAEAASDCDEHSDDTASTSFTLSRSPTTMAPLPASPRASMPDQA
jgi:MFS family permease